MWDLIVSVPDHCLSFYYVYSNVPENMAETSVPYLSLSDHFLVCLLGH